MSANQMHAQVIEQSKTQMGGIDMTENQVIESGEGMVRYRLHGTQAAGVPTYAVFFDGDDEELSIFPVCWFEIVRKIRPNREDQFIHIPVGITEGEMLQLNILTNYVGYSYSATPDKGDFEAQILDVKMGRSEPVIITKVPRED